MSRRAIAKKRSILPDPMYRSRLVSMIISRLLQDGKKNVARRILYESMEVLEELTSASLPSPQSSAGKLGVRSIDTGLNVLPGGTTVKATLNTIVATSSLASPVAFGDARPSANADVGPSTLQPIGSFYSEVGPKAKLTAQDGQSRGFALSLDSLKIFQQAVFNVTPVVEVKSRRVGGSNYQVPLEVNPERGTALALRWLIQAARQRPGREMSTKLANELLDASNKTGNAIRKREETHRMAEANKAFANYRF
jgi:ribosomal protein S7